jgi:hypothetical protein
MFTINQLTRRYIPKDLIHPKIIQLLCPSEAFDLQQPVTISNFYRRKPDILFDHHILQFATLFDRVRVFPQARFQAFRSTRTVLNSFQASQAKVLTGGGDLREAQVDVPLSVSHSCV